MKNGKLLTTKQFKHTGTPGELADAAKVEAIRNKALPTDKVIEEHPDLVNEIAALKIAEKFLADTELRANS